MCVTGALQVASIMLFSSYWCVCVCVWLFYVVVFVSLNCCLIVHVVVICTLSTFPREGVQYYDGH
jgi:hypothetical protein